MTTVRKMHVEQARTFNHFAIRYAIFNLHTFARQMRELRDDHMRRARNAMEVVV